MKYNRAVIITLAVALVSLFFGLAVLSEIKAELVKSSTKEYKQQQELLANQIADTIRNNLENAENQLIVMATMPELKDTSNVDQCNSKIAELLQINQRQLGNLARTDINGRFCLLRQ